MKRNRIKLEETDKIYKLSKNLYSINGEHFFTIIKNKEKKGKCNMCSFSAEKCILLSSTGILHNRYCLCFIMRCIESQLNMNPFSYFHVIESGSIIHDILLERFKKLKFEKQNESIIYDRVK